MKFFNVTTAPRTVTVGSRVVRFAPNVWSEDLTLEEVGSGGVQALLRKKVLRADPLSQLPASVNVSAPALGIVPAAAASMGQSLSEPQVLEPVVEESIVPAARAKRRQSEI